MMLHIGTEYIVLVLSPECPEYSDTHYFLKVSLSIVNDDM